MNLLLKILQKTEVKLYIPIPIIQITTDFKSQVIKILRKNQNYRPVNKRYWILNFLNLYA